MFCHERGTKLSGTEHPTRVRKVKGSIPVFVPRSWHDERYIFLISFQGNIYHLSLFINTENIS